MRTLAVGDIHGCFDALMLLAEAVDFQHRDRLITLGDYVDRGPKSREVVEWMIDWSREGQLVPLVGNHELMMIASRDDSEQLHYWSMVGGAETLASYSPDDAGKSLEHVPESHWRFFDETCLPWFETESHIFVHAGLISHLELDEQPDIVLFWERFAQPPPHQSGKIMVCGHTRQASGRPVNLQHAICIDTAACAHGWLTCLDVDSGHYWQSNEKGEVREGDL